jgi:4-hydroxy-3-polyprenylbenzoate decarboxylase
MTGASGSLYSLRLLQALLHAGRNVDLVISPAAIQVLQTEVDCPKSAITDPAAAILDLVRGLPALPALNADSAVQQTSPGSVTFHSHMDFTAGIASGSYRTAAMVICPCSMGTLASIAHGMSTNLIQRAADVHLKERRTLIVVPRETPLGSIQLENMKRLTDSGGIVLPAMPGFYHQPQSVMDLVDFVVQRICDHLGLVIPLTNRWGTSHDNNG